MSRAFELAASRPWLMLPDALDGLMAIADRQGDPEALEARLGRQLENTRAVTVRNGVAIIPVSVMREEHDNHGAALDRIYKITNNIRLPADACNTWTALYQGLGVFRDDLMEHIHLENNVLFNRIDGQMGGAQRY